MFIDLEKAYDSIDRKRLWEKLIHHYGLPKELLNGLQKIYQDISAILDIDTKKELLIYIVRGLKQGCPLSPLLFNLFFD